VFRDAPGSDLSAFLPSYVPLMNVIFPSLQTSSLSVLCLCWFINIPVASRPWYMFAHDLCFGTLSLMTEEKGHSTFGLRLRPNNETPRQSDVQEHRNTVFQ